jgi:hypothetical protein
MAEAAGVLYAVEHVLEGGLALAKGIYDPTLPLRATIKSINDVDLPRVHHSVSEAKGRAYVFGGKTDGDQVSFISKAIVDIYANKTLVSR